MKQMIYKPGGDTLVWGTLAKTQVIESDELDAYLAEGWLDHPSKLFEQPSEPAPKLRKGGRKSKDAGGADEFV
ncbi:hypothetical protein [Serratia marcescens]|uniref:Uncharacterized protein n=1 Tax=Serratia marcescens TaxID=615 RepID=A0A9X8YMH5_SERMA|nr:hypothetical protein [Serratia marcescens]MBS3894727.1 hypothetical protein [Serratia marcescens]